MNARDMEQRLPSRCAALARTTTAVARDRKEANVARLAAMVVHSRFPEQSSRLMRASEEYFARHPDELVAAADVVRYGWVFSLPRLKDMLTRRLEEDRA